VHGCGMRALKRKGAWRREYEHTGGGRERCVLDVAGNVFFKAPTDEPEIIFATVALGRDRSSSPGGRTE